MQKIILADGDLMGCEPGAVTEHVTKAKEHLQAAYNALPSTMKALIKIEPEVKPGTAPARKRAADESRREGNILGLLNDSITHLNATCGILKNAVEKEMSPTGDLTRASVLNDGRGHCLRALQAFYTFCQAMCDTGNAANVAVMTEVAKYASEFKTSPKGGPKAH
jgi:hypothetical protein